MTTGSLSTLLRPFAEAIVAKIEGLDVIEKHAGVRKKHHRARMLESISDDIKKASNFIPHQQSVRAHDKAKDSVDLSKMTWHDQPSFDPGRASFLVEHKEPVKKLRAACIKTRTVEGVLDVLTDQLCVVWVLREEDEELTRLKFRSNRPDSDAAYAKARIELWEDP